MTFEELEELEKAKIKRWRVSFEVRENGLLTSETLPSPPFPGMDNYTAAMDYRERVARLGEQYVNVRLVDATTFKPASDSVVRPYPPPRVTDTHGGSHT